jgi:hypothetical protein
MTGESPLGDWRDRKNPHFYISDEGVAAPVASGGDAPGTVLRFAFRDVTVVGP